MAKGGGSSYSETPEQKELARIALEEYQYMQQNYQPYEDRAIEQVLDSETMGNQIADITNVDFNQRFAEASPQVTQGIFARGLSLNSPAAQARLSGYGTDQAIATGAAQGAGVGLNEATRLDNASRLIAMGQGQQTQAVSGLAQNADAAQRQAIMDARAAAASRAALQQVVGAGLGIGAGYAFDKGLFTTPSTYSAQGTGLATPAPPSNFYMNQTVRPQG